MTERKARPDPEGENGSGSPPGGPGEGRYRSIAAYALIGDCHGAALVSRTGGIDRATLSRVKARLAPRSGARAGDPCRTMFSEIGNLDAM